MKTVLVCGAGVDKSEGIDMPLAAELVPKIRAFLKSTDDGQKIEATLRQIIPNLRFSYDKFVKEAVEKLSNEFRGQVADIVDRIGQELKDEHLDDKDAKLGRLIIALLIKIQKLQDDVKLDNETEALINEVFEGTISVEDDNIIQLPKLTFTDVFNNVMRAIFERSLEEPNHRILKHVRGNLMDFERLLMDSFIGFYTNNESQMKTYMYLSWTLWAYLKHCEQGVAHDNMPFYSSVPNEWDLVTLNYTSFARRIKGDKAHYFHGGLDSFIRMRDRQLVTVDGYANLDIPKFFSETVQANTTFGKNKRPNCVVPSIVPPLKMKPVLSNAFIEVWYRSKQAFQDAKRIVVVGYSFNYADEHFNDLIRCNKDKQIIVVDPFAESVLGNLQNIFSHGKDDYVVNKFQEKHSWSKDNLKIVKASATQIELDSI
ncbi:hypothetical protein [Methylomonas sp. ZR1]|uniref:hypothetical protein n=1 Tax=Methylomonas sp. ZR1 TaxID=1797072 RepID=UPI001490BEAA|nr:hypothetical protein [Methylomonas sp. ZR1]NOV29245.1 hypothetical protein [Methylomonas sp. ZR1]